MQREEKGITIKLMPKALSNGNPTKLSNGILTEPPPIPDIPLIYPANMPIKK